MTTHAGENADSLQPDDPRELGPYRLLARLGRGGMGTVYLGEHSAESGSGRRVAVKVINRELASEAAFRERFRREVTAARQVRRFCTAPVLDAELDRDPLYVVTEYIEGPSLERAVAERGPLPGSDLEGLAVGVATALAAIHGAGIVHRDLKPANVLLSPTGPRVIDFGIARALDAADGPTRTGQFVGTPNYLAPELLRGEPVTPASDVFSWGCVVAFAGTGRPPFAGSTVPEIFYKVAHEAPQLDGLDPSLRELVAAALDKDPNNRPSVGELLSRLVGHTQPDPARLAETVQATWHAGVGARAATAPPLGPTAGATREDTPPPPPPLRFASTAVRKPQRRPSRRATLLTVGAGVAAVALGAALLAAVVGGDSPPEDLATVFSDDFSNSNSGWGGGTYTLSNGYTNEGKYRMDADFGTQLRERYAPKEGKDMPARVLVSVTGTLVEGQDDAQYGLSCRSTDDGEREYLFLVRKDGKGGLLRKKAGDLGSKELVTLESTPVEKDGPNRLQIACEEQDKGKKVRLRLWVNGDQVIDQTDGDQPLPNGWAGIAVQRGANAAQKAIADFDDFDLSRIDG
ncbi:hypothetical protein Arub01_36960 [Actinomadura rubrobrunea]|uniref:Protein kinase domain-containing protein n=1 Tax=Actinomadura rubrobrunea TaxID=115335 RepID=A0A9W6PX93_9ACTN|nr:serine/threonine-protein kinase [Actinomadura rubrobrunea]GLW65452.1 hypothetical protein Arub01_36960 [Actinomadura rubrobrunea]